jgi:putative transposase
MNKAVERHIIEGNEEIMELGFAAARLYNKINFHVRQIYFENRNKEVKIKFPSPSTIYKLFCKTEEWLSLGNSKTASQIIYNVKDDWTSYWNALKSFKQNPTLFKSCPKPPKYKKKYHKLTFYTQTVKTQQLRNGIIEPTNGLFKIHSPKAKYFKEATITPKGKDFIINIIYDDVACYNKVHEVGTMSIDLGINNLMTITSDKLDNPILIDGREIK